MSKLIVGLLLTCMCGGCGRAGLAYDVLTHDNVIAAAREAKKGVEAFNVAVVAGTAARQDDMLDAVGKGIAQLAQDGSIKPEAAKALAQSVVTSLKAHLANYAEQERRRANLYEVTIDNLNYIIQISEQGKTFSIYRADIGVQWKSYLESSAKTAIGTIK